MSMVFLATGNCHLGRTDRDENGNIIKETPPHFEFDDKGGSVILGLLNPDTMEQIGEASVYGDFNASGYLSKVLKVLNPNRNIDIPNFKNIFNSLHNDGIDICEHCENYNCSNCIITEWKQEVE